MEKSCTNTIDKETRIYYTILKRQDIIKFTYEDYLRCIEERKRKPYLKIQEEQGKYEITGKERVHHPHDKTYRKLLSNRKDGSYIINKALKLKEKIDSEELEKYNSSFVTRQFIDREADIVYKMKNSNTYFLIEHQSKVDYSMPSRIQEYKFEIIKSAVDMNKIKTKEYKMPYIVPIVIYTGKERWNVSLYLEEIQDNRLESLNELKYNLIDVNKLKKENLLKSKHLIDKIFLLEKMKSPEELGKIIEKIILQLDEKEELEMFIQIITITLKDNIESKKIKEIINKNMKGESKEMLENVVEMLKENDLRMKSIGRKEGRKEGREEGRSEGKKEGIKEGINKVLTNMLAKGMTVDQIKEITGLSSKEIEQATS